MNNDICYPSILVTGQIMEAVMSGRYDTDKLAVLITKPAEAAARPTTSRSSAKALKSVGLGHVRLSRCRSRTSGEVNPGFKITPKMLLQAIYALCYGDLLMQCLYRTRPYEVEPGSATNLFDHWMATCKAQLAAGVTRGGFKKTVKQIVDDFDTLPLQGEGTKPRVGVVGEILVKFHPGQQSDRRSDRARGLRGRGAGAHRVLPVRPCGRDLPEKTRSDVRRRALRAAASPSRPSRVPRAGDPRARAIAAFRARDRHLRAGGVRKRDPFAVQLDGGGLVAHRRDGGAGSQRLPERGVHAAVRLPAEPCGGQIRHQGAAPQSTPRATSWRSTTIQRLEVNQLNRIKLMIAVAKANLAEKEKEARVARDEFVDPLHAYHVCKDKVELREGEDGDGRVADRPQCGG